MPSQDDPFFQEIRHEVHIQGRVDLLDKTVEQLIASFPELKDLYNLSQTKQQHNFQRCWYCFKKNESKKLNEVAGVIHQPIEVAAAVHPIEVATVVHPLSTVSSGVFNNVPLVVEMMDRIKMICKITMRIHRSYSTICTNLNVIHQIGAWNQNLAEESSKIVEAVNNCLLHRVKQHAFEKVRDYREAIMVHKELIEE
jgi:hypothetical protein